MKSINEFRFETYESCDTIKDAEKKRALA